MEPRPTAPRPDRSNAWGRTQFVALTDAPIECARVQFEQSEDLLVQCDVLQPSTVSPIDHPQPFVWLTVTYGTGAVSVTRKVLVIDRFDVALTTAFCQISVYIGDSAGNPLIANANTAGGTYSEAQVAIQIGRGNRALPYVASRFQEVNLNGASGTQVAFQFSAIPAQLLSVESHLAASSSGTEMFMQFFDVAAQPVNAASPVMEVRLGTLPEHGLGIQRLLNPRGFAVGIWAVLSTTSGSLTQAALSSQACRVMAETQQL